MAYDGSIKIDTSIDTSGFQGAIGKVGGFLKAGLGGMATLFAATGSAIAGLATASAKIGMDFEAQMSRVSAIAGAYGDELDALTQQAMDLGASTAFSATEAAQGMEKLASAGFTSSQIMAAMPGLLDLAASDALELGTAAEIAGAALNGFGMDVEGMVNGISTTEHVANVLAKAAADTNASVESMGMGLKFVAPVAASVGWSFEETAAAMGLLSNAGITGAMSGTALRSVISRLIKPTKQTQEALNGLGIEVYDSNGKMKELNVIVDELGSATSGLSDEQRNLALATIFGQESVAGITVLMNQGGDALREMTAGFEDSAGAANEMATTMQDNLKGALEEMGGAAETLGIQVYGIMKGPLQGAVTGLTGYVNQLGEAFKAGGDSAEDSLNNLAGAFGTVLASIVQDIASKAPEFIGLAQTLLMNLIQGLTDNMGPITESAVQIVTSLADAFIAVGGEILHKGAWLARQLLAGLVPELPRIAQAFVEAIGNAIPMMLTLVPELLKAGVAVATGIWQGMANTLPNILNEVLMTVSEIPYILLDLMPVLLDAAIQLFSTMAEALPEVVSGLIFVIGETVATIGELIIQNAPVLLNAAIQLFTGLLTGAIELIPQLVDTVIGIIGTIVTVITSLVPELIDGAIQLFMGIVNAIPLILPALVSALPQILTAVLNGLLAMLPAVTDGAIALLSAIVDAIPIVIQSLIAVLPTILPPILNALLTAIPLLLDAAIQFFMAVVEAIPVIVNALVGELPRIIQTVLEALRDALPAILDGAVSLLMAIVQAIPVIINALKPVLPNIIRTILDAVITSFPLLLSAAIEFFMALIDALPTIVNALIGALPTIITTIVNFITDNVEVILEAAVTLFFALIEAIPVLIVALLVEIPKIIRTILTVLKDAIPAVLKAGLDLLLGVWNAIPEAASRIGRKVPEIITKIATALKNGIPKLSEIGKNLIQGLWNGISSVGDWIKGKVKGFMDGIVGGIKKFFGIGSPATLIKDQVGRWIPAGLVVGVEAEMPKSTKKVTSAFSGIVDKARDVVEAGSMDLSSELLASGTVRMAGGFDAGGNDPSLGVLGEMRDILGEFLPMFANLAIVLDDGTLVGRLGKPIDDQLGIIRRNSRRGN